MFIHSNYIYFYSWAKNRNIINNKHHQTNNNNQLTPKPKKLFTTTITYIQNILTNKNKPKYVLLMTTPRTKNNIHLNANTVTKTKKNAYGIFISGENISLVILHLIQFMV